MQQRRHAARMALAGRAGEDDVARRRAARVASAARRPSIRIATPDRSSATPQPWMRPPSIDAGEGIALPPLGARYRLAVGMGEEDQAAAAAGSRKARDDALAFACIDRAARWRTRRPSARRPAGNAPSPRCSRAIAPRRRRAAAPPLRRRAARGSGSAGTRPGQHSSFRWERGSPEPARIMHHERVTGEPALPAMNSFQITTRASRRRSTRIRLKVV